LPTTLTATGAVMKPHYQINDFIPAPDTHKDRWEVYDIKQGGMGWVYIVYDHKTGEPFAVKTYKDKWLQKEKAKENFKKEALVWINLDRHENITQARFIEEIQNRIYIFLEYVVGGDLSRYIGTKLLDVKQIIKFALQFCYGMEHAVTHGIVCHRDIKPSNCLITEDKTLKITDFGLAKTLYTHVEITNQVSTKNKNYIDLSKTKTGEMGGTPFYMAPEQFEDTKYLDIRSDIYSFGVMLYELISGKLPFYGNTWNELKESHKKKEIPSLSSYLRKEEKPLFDIVSKCMAKQPDDRYVDFTQVKKEFTQIYMLLYNENPSLPKKGIELNFIELNNKGVSLNKLNHYQEALDCYDKALEINPNFSILWCNKGSTYEKLNCNQKAIECCDKALEINPKNSQAWCNKSSALGNLNRNQEALECCDKALENDSHFSLSWYNKGSTLGNLKRYQEALECYDKTLEIDPKYSQAWFNKGLVLEKLNLNKEAIACYNKTLEIDPRNSKAWYYKGAVLAILNRYQEAIECYNEALEIDPKNSKIWYDKGDALGNLNRHQETIECCNKALEIDPENSKAWYNKGNALGNLKLYQKTIECCDKALEIDPEFSLAWYNKGYALAKLGYLFQALKSLQKAKQLGDPKAEQAIAYCQQLLQQQGEL
jgi:tetratricopeptide (TPR) repeat protein